MPVGPPLLHRRLLLDLLLLWTRLRTSRAWTSTVRSGEGGVCGEEGGRGGRVEGKEGLLAYQIVVRHGCCCGAQRLLLLTLELLHVCGVGVRMLD